MELLLRSCSSPALTVHHDDGVPVIAVTGDVDMATDNAISVEIGDQFAMRPRALIIDMTEVTFLGLAGVTLLVAAATMAQRCGVRLAVVTSRRAVLRVLELTNVNRLLDLHRTLPDALVQLRPPADPRDLGTGVGVVPVDLVS
ncbi:STAS domain-containing protein [Lentzea sp. NPDC051213]|uniref:STAS domain-containing protein n=1 Tax=Lentzea sp. NPDC051213 TaxID=3364126 RepID=UPI00378BD951